MLWERVQYFSFQHVSGFDTSYACLDSIHALNVIYFFSSHRPKRFWSDRKKLSHFGQKVWKFRLKNTVMVSFNTTVRQMTEMFQWKKTQNVIRAWIRLRMSYVRGFDSQILWNRFVEPPSTLTMEKGISELKQQKVIAQLLAMIAQ